MNNQDSAAEGFGKKLFTFAVVADSHLNEKEDECSSPYEANHKSNARLRHVVGRLETEQPEFVIHLGDLIHPVPSLPSYKDAADKFNAQIASSSFDWYLVPGNHDVGDKPLPWAPAATVTSEYVGLWRQHFGSDFYSFDRNNIRFIVINASIINSGIEAEAAQRDWLEALLAGSRGMRVILCTHYPPYLTTTDELEHYDNIAEPGRSWILGLIEEHGIEAMFAGHVHNFWYYRHGETDCYLLPSTSFIRHDYSEMYHIEPGTEGGRDDAAKLGYFLVDVHERGVLCHMQRTNGVMEAPEDLPVAKPSSLKPVHPAENHRAPFGFEMRYAWAEETDIPPSGGVDDFVRRRVRNDYPLLALWEMGVRRHLIPVQDMRDARVRERIRIMRRFGHRFILQSFALPDPAALAAVADHRDLVDGWMFVMGTDREAGFAAISEAMRRTDLPVYLSRILDGKDIRQNGDKYYHVIAHGFATVEGPLIADWAARLPRPLAGAVFRILGPENPGIVIREAATVAKKLDLEAMMYLRQSQTFNPAYHSNDERIALDRVAGALFSAIAADNVTVYSDTLADVDRGYFRRAGVLDRRFNPKPASLVIRHLHAVLNADPEPLSCIAAIAGGTRIPAAAGKRTVHVLALPGEMEALSSLETSADLPKSGNVQVTDLETGGVSDAAYKRKGKVVTLSKQLAVTAATLLTFPV
jgi:hypothetical protein